MNRDIHPTTKQLESALALEPRTACTLPLFHHPQYINTWLTFFEQPENHVYIGCFLHNIRHAIMQTNDTIVQRVYTRIMEQHNLTELTITHVHDICKQWSVYNSMMHQQKNNTLTPNRFTKEQIHHLFSKTEFERHDMHTHSIIMKHYIHHHMKPNETEYNNWHHDAQILYKRTLVHEYHKRNETKQIRSHYTESVLTNVHIFKPTEHEHMPYAPFDVTEDFATHCYEYVAEHNGNHIAVYLYLNACRNKIELHTDIHRQHQQFMKQMVRNVQSWIRKHAYRHQSIGEPDKLIHTLIENSNALNVLQQIPLVCTTHEKEQLIAYVHALDATNEYHGALISVIQKEYVRETHTTHSDDVYVRALIATHLHHVKQQVYTNHEYDEWLQYLRDESKHITFTTNELIHLFPQLLADCAVDQWRTGEHDHPILQIQHIGRTILETKHLHHYLTMDERIQLIAYIIDIEQANYQQMYQQNTDPVSMHHLQYEQCVHNTQLQESWVKPMLRNITQPHYTTIMLHILYDTPVTATYVEQIHVCIKRAPEKINIP